MWILTLRAPTTSPIDYRLKPGSNTLGRKPDNDISIPDESASRKHAEIFCQEDTLVISDLESTNGTFVNRERIAEPRALRSGDQVRIGKHVAMVSYRDDSNPSNLIASLSGTRPFTRDLLLESVDQHAVLLYEVASRLSTILDLQAAIQEITKLTKISTGAEKCEIILAEHFDQLNELGFPTSIAMQAIEQRSVVIIPDVNKMNHQPPSKSALLFKIRSVLCAPVMIEGEVAALVYVYKTDPTARPFDQSDVQIAVAISHQTALTIQRGHLLERSRFLEEKVNYDSLTGLYNRDRFIDLAENEVQRSIRFKHSLTIMMLDIDQFKPVNDTYGHLVGDQVLQVVAARCRRQVREIDMICRYGGDEFIFLLVETGLEEAQAIAERIRQRVADSPAETERGPLNITVSLGLATLSEKNPNLMTLINGADNALYNAKKGGRNLVEIAD